VPPPPAALDYAALRAAAQGTLRESLRVVEPAVRVQGSDDLGKIKDQPSVPTLADLTEHDPDAEVRGHSAAALGVLGAASTARVLARLEDDAPPALKVWYASALARLGDKGAARRLLTYARSADLAVAFPAALMLADASVPGDKKVTAALQAMASREAELAQQDPYAGVTLAAKLTALRDARARDYLYGLLGHAREDVRLAAAEGLARLGSDEGKTVLGQVAANPASPNRLVAAVTQIAVGEYGGLDVMTQMLNAKDPGNRRLAASGIGQIGDRRSLPALVALAGDPDWTVRLEVARAIVAIVGLDPALLAQAAVDWTRSALDAQDLAVRRAAAGVLADIPASDAIPLLALAIKDKEPSVRREASKSAGKMKSGAAAVKVADALATESDPGAKEEEVRALAEIGAVGNPAAHDALARILEEPGRIGVLAAGSLIAGGDVAANARLTTAIASSRAELRLAAVDAAAIAHDSIVVPTLKIGVVDRVFDIRFSSAVGLSLFNAERADAVPVLNAALVSKNFDVVGRALAALRRFGEAFTRPERKPSDLLGSADPAQRLAVVPVVRVMPGGEAVPLLRRLVADADPDVRRAGVDAIETLKDKEQAVRLYKPLVEDGDPLIRCRAAGQLSRLVPPVPVAHAEAAPGTDPARARAAEALSSTKIAANEVTTEIDGMEQMLAELSGTMAATPAPGDVPTDRVKHLAASIGEAQTRAEAALARAEAAARAAADAAGPSPPPGTASLVDEAAASARRTREALAVAGQKATAAVRKAGDFIADWTGDAQLDIDTANAKIDTGNFAEARRLLDKATRELRKSGNKSPGLDFAYAQLFDKMAIEAESPADKQKLLQEAADAYRRVVKIGGGRFARVAKERLAKIPDEISGLGTP
jgi:HEAT repeat protein